LVSEPATGWSQQAFLLNHQEDLTYTFKQLLWVPDLAKEYGFTDIDGRFIPRFDPKAPQQDYPC
jgi:hypothetical protein